MKRGTPTKKKDEDYEKVGYPPRRWRVYQLWQRPPPLSGITTTTTTSPMKELFPVIWDDGKNERVIVANGDDNMMTQLKNGLHGRPQTGLAAGKRS